MNKLSKELISAIFFFWERILHGLPKISSIYFHDPSPDLFEMVMKWYKKHHYRIISLKELKGLLESKQQPKERVAYISFDDGKRSNLDLLPLCEKYNAPITVFVATEPLTSGNYWWEFAVKKLGRHQMLELKKLPEKEFYDQMKEIKKGIHLERSSMTINELKQFAKHPLVTIQSHTVNHPVLTNSSDETLIMEVAESKRILEELVGYPIEVFSYPNGDVGQREIDAIKKAGYKYAFTTEAADFDVVDYNPYLLPRMSLNTLGGKYDNLAKLLGIWYKVMSKIRK